MKKQSEKSKVNEAPFSQLGKLKKKIESGDKKTINTITIATLGILLLLLIFNVSNSFIAGNIISSKIAEIKEANKPAEISILILEANCLDCQDIQETLDYLKGTNVKINSEKTLAQNSEKSKELISQYNIQKLPTIIVLGELNKTNLKGFSEISDALIYDSMPAPFIDSKTNQIKGMVEILNIIDSSCPECVSLDVISNAFLQGGVKFSNQKSVESSSQEGKSLIEKYGITQLPSMLISKDIDEYPKLSQQLAFLNPSEKYGYYKIHSTVPPFKDLSTGNVNGLTEVIYLTDESCTTCYDVSVNRGILEGIGLYLDKENTYDVSSSKGKELIGKYKITKVPMILVSPQASDYEVFEQVWKQVGEKSSDGWFIMGKPEVIGTYKDLGTGKVINPQEATTPTSSPPSQIGVKEFSMTAKQFEFSPSTITVNKGDKVIITVKSIDVAHGISIPEFGINVAFNPGEEKKIEFIANKAGTFPFACSVYCGDGHGQMKGQLIVK